MGFSEEDAMIELEMEEENEYIREEIPKLSIEILLNGRQLKKELMVKDLGRG